jgi:hypothetical protein
MQLSAAAIFANHFGGETKTYVAAGGIPNQAFSLLVSSELWIITRTVQRESTLIFM